MRILIVLLIVLLGACDRSRDAADHAHPEDESWAVTAWGTAYEIFAECDPLVAGAKATSHTHVTVLGDFSPLRSGSVSAVLKAADGSETVFTRDTPLRDGIFSIDIEPAQAGEYDLVFRVEAEAGNEEIASGRVVVGTEAGPGGLSGEAESHTHAGEASHHDRHEPAGEVVSFLKEQQWRTEFRTTWAEPGDVAASVRAPATIRAAAGSEVLLTAPLDGIVSADTRVYVGRAVRRGDVLVSLAPRALSNVTLPELEAETEVARSRVVRLEELLELGAVSPAEVEAARARLAALEPRLAAAKGSTSGNLAVHAPFDGRIAESHVTPGASANAGDPLVRVVRTPPVWIEVAVPPAEIGRLHENPTGISLESRSAGSILIGRDDLRLVSVSPVVDAETGTVTVILETNRVVPFPLGSLVSAEILLAETSRGIVVPGSAIVDDAGITVVYVQVEGESFERRPVDILARRGNDIVVHGLFADDRVVVVGGNAIRRATLLSGGEVEGHVH